MKKKLKAGKVFRNTFLFIIILGMLGATFYFGYYQFQLPVDNYAVIFTKINKWDPEVVKPGNFRFEWEGLIPLNLKMEKFPLKPIRKSITISGVLPSASVYSTYLAKDPDFSYKFSFDINYILNPESLPMLCEKQFLRHDSYNTFLLDIENELTTEASGYLRKIIENESKLKEANYDYSFLSDNLKKHLSNKYLYITFIDFTPTDVYFPDIELYTEAKKQYFEMEKYLEGVKMSALKETETKMIKEQANLDILRKYGEVFKQYPNLAEYYTLYKNEKQNILPEVELPEN